jgi:endonuclease G
MDRDIDAALISKAHEAATRWKKREEVRRSRTAALERNAPLEADSPARVALRLNNLIDDVRKSTAGRRPPDNPVLKSLVERPLPITAEEIDDAIVNEVVLGARNFLSVEFLERGVVAARCIGRVLIRSGGDFRARGTGFLVAPGLLLTNEHVLTSATLAGRCVLEMDYELNRFGPPKTAQTFALEPELIFLNDEDLDYALVAVAQASSAGTALAGYGWLPLNAALGKISISDKDFLNIVQHPLGREKEVVIRNNRVLDMRTANEPAAEALGAFLHYEGDTEKGSSGSPVMNDGWEVVGLHHSGVPASDEAGNWLDKDGGIWREGEQPVDRIQWVANEALRVSSLMAAIAIADLPADKRELLSTAMSAQAPILLGEKTQAEEAPVGEEAVAERRTEQSKARTRESQVETGARSRSATIEVPLRITIELGGEPLEKRGVELVTARSAVARSGIAEERLEPQDFADRDGYDRRFLGAALPLPTLKSQPRFGGALVVPRPARPGDRIELRYHNYSTIHCPGRRLAYISACNLNFAAAATAGRKQGRNTWRTDPRLNAEDQLASRFYDHNDYDKGHLTRRDDTAWGDTLQRAIAANDDTFFYTNAAPQHRLFNQSDDFTGAGLDLWGDLENFISKQGERQRTRLTIFNGPIFGHSDKPLHDALVPLRFYKVVAWKDEGEEPGAVAFVLDQSGLVRSLPEEGIDPGRFEIRQRRIRDIEADLDLDLLDVKSWDRLSGRTDEALDRDGLLITEAADIRI